MIQRCPELAIFLGVELLAVAKAMADGSYWREDAAHDTRPQDFQIIDPASGWGD